MPSTKRQGRKSEALVLFPFGPGVYARPGKHEERAVTFSERLLGVWALLVRWALEFTGRLSRPERALLSAEDLLQHVALALLEEDRRFDPARAGYRTFAWNVFRTVSRRERARARAVALPPRSWHRLQELRGFARERALSAREARLLGELEDGYRQSLPLDQQAEEAASEPL